MSKLYWIISLLLDQVQEQEIRFPLITLRKENMGRRSFKKHFKFHNFSEMFYCVMTRLRNTSLSAFMQCQYRRKILRNKIKAQILLKKHSKFQNFDEICSCDLTWLRNTNLDVFIQRHYTRTISRKKNMGQSCLRNIQNF